MPETPPTPDPAPLRRSPLRRPTILLIMVVVAMIAIALGAIRYRWTVAARQLRMEALAAQLAQAEARMAWSQRMQRLGYVSAATAAADRRALEKARAELRTFEGR